MGQRIRFQPGGGRDGVTGKMMYLYVFIMYLCSFSWVGDVSCMEGSSKNAASFLCTDVIKFQSRY